MYYEECVIDGILHYRTNPKGEWKSFSLSELTAVYCNIKAMNADLLALLDKLD